MSVKDQPTRTESPWQGIRERGRRVLATPQFNYKVIMSVTAILVLIGLTMVLSSSMVTSIDSDTGVFGEFMKQAVVVAAGLVGMWFFLRITPSTVRNLSVVFLAISLVLLILVLIPGIGVGGTEVGSNSWIRFAGIGIQPSEVAKFSLAVWGAAVVAARSRVSNSARFVLNPFFVVCAVILGLVLLQDDLGMMLSLAAVVAAMLFFAGVSTMALMSVVAAAGVVFVIYSLQHTFRSARFSSWTETFTLSFNDATSRGATFQSRQGILSLSDGGLLGQGLGQSRAKWLYLPEAANDFVFAILGEELGLLGAGLVVILFGVLAWFGIRTATAQTDPFLRLLAAALTMGITVQAFYNMGYVVGLFPMTGVQLPLISAGGSSAVVTLASLGLLANIARHEPATVSSMQHEGRPLIDRILFLPEPEPYRPGQERRERVREQPKRYGEPVTRRRRPPPGEPSGERSSEPRYRGQREPLPEPRRSRSTRNSNHTNQQYNRRRR
ncbi:peptidoglycan glycosyltransferase FtsW [Corynebacterium sp. AOP40-9SA-29]|uniref:peptidoglycan glycosyltransferase FtsW n=1 Tax=Corynebacterium sp. AOP40-9SA-29 TaxID=3457677 RepID=UPI0040339652